MHDARSSTDPLPVRVFIVDGDRRVRSSLEGLLCECEGILVVGTAADGDAALRLIEEARPDVVLLDPRLPEVDAGLWLMRSLRERCPAVRVVAMNVSSAIESPALATGAVSFVPKAGTPGDLVEAVLTGAAKPGDEGRSRSEASVAATEPSMRGLDALPDPDAASLPGGTL